MRETPKRVISAIVALGLITVFVVGAVELATEPESEPASTPTTVNEQTSESEAATPPTDTPAGAPDAATTPSNPPNATGVADLPSTGPADFMLVSLALTALLLSSRLYWRSRRDLRHFQLHHS